MAGPGNHCHGHAFRCLELRQLRVLKIAVPRGVHLLGAVQVQPELKALHHALILLRDFRMDHALASRHPLHPPVLQQAFVASAVAVQHAPGDHVCHGFKAPVRVVRKSGDVVVGLVAAKSIQHQKRVKPVLQVLREDAAELDARAVGCGLAGDQAFDGPGDGNRVGGGKTGQGILL